MKKTNAVVLIGLITLLIAGCSEQKGPAERAGEKIDNAVSESKDAVENATDNVADKIEEAGDKVKK